MEKRKKNLTEEDGQAMVAQYRSSGMSQAKFAEKAGMTAAALQYWVGKIRRREKLKTSSSPKTLQFVEVVSQRSQSVSINSSGATLDLCGVSLRFDKLPPAEYIARIAFELKKISSC